MGRFSRHRCRIDVRRRHELRSADQYLECWFAHEHGAYVRRCNQLWSHCRVSRRLERLERDRYDGDVRQYLVLQRQRFGVVDEQSRTCSWCLCPCRCIRSVARDVGHHASREWRRNRYRVFGYVNGELFKDARGLGPSSAANTSTQFNSIECQRQNL